MYGRHIIEIQIVGSALEISDVYQIVSYGDQVMEAFGFWKSHPMYNHYAYVVDEAMFNPMHSMHDEGTFWETLREIMGEEALVYKESTIEEAVDSIIERG